MQVRIPHVYVSTCGRNIAVMLYWRVTRAACVGRARSLRALAYMRHSVCGVCGGGGAASVPHISRGVLLARPDRGPLRFMECHSVAAAVNQVNVAEPISSVVPRSRWKNNI